MIAINSRLSDHFEHKNVYMTSSSEQPPMGVAKSDTFIYNGVVLKETDTEERGWDLDDTRFQRKNRLEEYAKEIPVWNSPNKDLSHYYYDARPNADLYRLKKSLDEESYIEESVGYDSDDEDQVFEEFDPDPLGEDEPMEEDSESEVDMDDLLWHYGNHDDEDESEESDN